jgi:isoleucyl-tRNA synthetase
MYTRTLALTLACARAWAVTEDGRFTADAPGGLGGLPIHTAGTEHVLAQLVSSPARLVARRPYRHRYPYDWRSRQPVIVRCVSVCLCV